METAAGRRDGTHEAALLDGVVAGPAAGSFSGVRRLAPAGLLQAAIPTDNHSLSWPAPSMTSLATSSPPGTST